MKPGRWARIEDLYHRALEVEGSQRAAFLRDTCANDSELQQEVELLLAQDRQAGSFLETPAFREITHDVTSNSGQTCFPDSVPPITVVLNWDAGLWR